jgi:hypothetical protein
MTALAPSMQAYFTDRLIAQRRASPNTIAAYRHTFQLLLQFVTDRTGTSPSPPRLIGGERTVRSPPRTVWLAHCAAITASAAGEGSRRRSCCC